MAGKGLHCPLLLAALSLWVDFPARTAPGTPEQLADAIRTDMKTYGERVRLTGATAD
jgi:hypothetical protein